jgi:hypothetical protein
MIEIEITRRKGEKFLARFDKDDEDIAKGFSWYVSKGYLCGYLRGSGKRNSKKVTASRVIMEKALNRKLDKLEWVDHLNHDTFDNRKGNLGVKDPAGNHRNQLPCRGTVSRFKWVSNGTRKGGFVAGLFRKGIGITGKVTLDEEQAAMAGDCIAWLMPEEYLLPNFPDKTPQEKWFIIGAAHRNQIRHSLRLHSLWTEEARGKAGEFENAVELHGASKNGKWGWVSSVKVLRYTVSGATTKDKSVAYMAYDCIVELCNLRGIENYPSLSFEYKWERIGEKQRKQILHSLEKHGLITEDIRKLIT